MAIAFNAGIWGYDSWLPTLVYLSQRSVGYTVPFVITSYTVEEGEDDGEVVEELLTKDGNVGQCCWECERNTFGSNKERETKSNTKGTVYRENGAWQCWLFGGAGAK
eukprot:9748008-Ditylum_brightwellii.AAC.1